MTGQPGATPGHGEGLPAVTASPMLTRARLLSTGFPEAWQDLKKGSSRLESRGPSPCPNRPELTEHALARYFKFRSADDLLAESRRLGVDLRLSDDLDPL